MTTGIFAKIGSTHVLSELHIELWDYDDDGNAVWRVSVWDDMRYIEGGIDDDVWLIVERACRAYDD